MMRSLWMGIVPGMEATRVLLLDGPGKAMMKARLPVEPRHPRAVEVLCEAIALWCGQPVRAVLAVGERERSSDTRHWFDTVDAIAKSPLYELELVARVRPPRERDNLGGMGNFHDVRQLLLFEVAR